MPKLYEYLGIAIFFYSNDHAPIHVHARKGEREVKVEITVEPGGDYTWKIQPVRGRPSLTQHECKQLEAFIQAYAADIVAKWVQYFVYHQSIKFERINQRLK